VSRSPHTRRVASRQVGVMRSTASPSDRHHSDTRSSPNGGSGPEAYDTWPGQRGSKRIRPSGRTSHHRHPPSSGIAPKRPRREISRVAPQRLAAAADRAQEPQERQRRRPGPSSKQHSGRSGNPSSEVAFVAPVRAPVDAFVEAAPNLPLTTQRSAAARPPPPGEDHRRLQSSATRPSTTRPFTRRS